ncbi:MAG: hypothetical protein TUN42_10210 [Dehalogenimonas sp.]
MNDSLGAIGLTVLLMIIPGIALMVHGIKSFRNIKVKMPSPESKLRLYDWILVTVGLGLSIFVLSAFIRMIDQG